MAVAAALAVFAAILFLTRDRWLSAAGRWLDVGQPPRQSDYCLVLSGDVFSRPFAAAALYRHGFVREQIWLTRVGLLGNQSLQSPNEIAAATRILSAMGVPPDKIAAIGGPCLSTFDEVQSLAGALAEHPNATVTVVTSNYHTRRARWAIDRVLGSEAAGRVRLVSVPTDFYDANCWWRGEEGLSVYLKEFAKLPFYWVRYGWGGVWIGVVAGLAVLCWAGRRFFRRRTGETASGSPQPV